MKIRPNLNPGTNRTSGLLTAMLLAAAAVTGTACTSTMAAQHPTPKLELTQELDPRTLVMAERAMAGGRFGDAETLLRRVLAAEPGNSDAGFLLAELHLVTGKPAQAGAIFTALAETVDAELSAAALQGKGISLILLGNQDEGRESLEHAVEQDPSLWRAWNALGAWNDARGEWKEARHNYQKALDIRPDSALVYNNLGFSNVLQGRFDQGIEGLNKALQLEPDLGPARRNLRLAFAWKGKYVHALAGADRADMARVLNNVGFVALLRGDYTNAESYLLRAIELDRGFNDNASRNLSYLKDVRDIEAADRIGAD